MELTRYIGIELTLQSMMVIMVMMMIGPIITANMTKMSVSLDWLSSVSDDRVELMVIVAWGGKGREGGREGERERRGRKERKCMHLEKPHLLKQRARNMLEVHTCWNTVEVCTYLCISMQICFLKVKLWTHNGRVWLGGHVNDILAGYIEWHISHRR